MSYNNFISRQEMGTVSIDNLAKMVNELIDENEENVNDLDSVIMTLKSSGEETWLLEEKIAFQMSSLQKKSIQLNQK